MLETAHNVISDLAPFRVEGCYQCGKCTAGCPVAESMDLMPNQIVRLTQTGDLPRSTSSRAIWLCVSCQTCSERCPKCVDIAGVMDGLRQLSAERGQLNVGTAPTVAFQRAFLDNIRRNGRLNELELIARFKTQAFVKNASIPNFFKDALLAPKLMKRGKLHLRGERVQDRDVVKRIFDRCVERV